MAKDAHARFRTAFGAALSEQLAKKRMNQADLSEAIGRSRSYTSQTMSGTKPASPEWVELVANALKLSEPDRVKLHRAAASDAGYKLDLTKK